MRSETLTIDEGNEQGIVPPGPTERAVSEILGDSGVAEVPGEEPYAYQDDQHVPVHEPEGFDLGHVARHDHGDDAQQGEAYGVDFSRDDEGDRDDEGQIHTDKVLHLRRPAHGVRFGSSSDPPSPVRSPPPSSVASGRAQRREGRSPSRHGRLPA